MRAVSDSPLRWRRRAGALAVAGVAALFVPSAAHAQTLVDINQLGPPPVGAAAAEDYPWRARIAAARAWANRRGVRVSFAVVDEQGRLRGSARSRRYVSASLVKAMLLVGYLHRARGRALTSGERARLGPMIRVSDNRAASWAYARVRPAGLRRVARRAGMTRFSPSAAWGSSLVTAADQARFFVRLDKLVPARHRSYARDLLASIAGAQRWGIPRVAPPGFRVFFKGGWRPRGDWTVNQAALLERGSRRLSVAILTRGNGSFGRGIESVRGTASRLLRGYERY